MSSDSPKARMSTKAMALVLVPTCVGIALYIDHVRKQQPHYRKIATYPLHMEPVKVTGEVVDAWCYASQTMGPGRGEGHVACATACVSGGVTAGILEDKTKILYIAAKYKGFQGCRELLLPFIGRKVTATGWVGDLGGSRLLKIANVTPVDTDATSTNKTAASTATETATGAAKSAATNAATSGDVLGQSKGSEAAAGAQADATVKANPDNSCPSHK